MTTRQTSSGMPQMGAAFGGWTSRINLLRHTETVVDGFVTVNEYPLSFNGTIQPLSARAISLKPEGQRSWTWLQIHAIAIQTLLIPGDFLTWQNQKYKVMEQKDYSLNGYVEYHIVRYFQDGAC